jgi:hypothetical protein
MTATATDQQIAGYAYSQRHIDDFIRKDYSSYRIEVTIRNAIARRITGEVLRAHEREYRGFLQLLRATTEGMARNDFLSAAVQLISEFSGDARCRIVEFDSTAQAARLRADSETDVEDSSENLRAFKNLTEIAVLPDSDPIKELTRLMPDHMIAPIGRSAQPVGYLLVGPPKRTDVNVEHRFVELAAEIVGLAGC